jgi:hypothetical protein
VASGDNKTALSKSKASEMGKRSSNKGIPQAVTFNPPVKNEVTHQLEGLGFDTVTEYVDNIREMDDNFKENQPYLTPEKQLKYFFDRSRMLMPLLEYQYVKRANDKKIEKTTVNVDYNKMIESLNSKLVPEPIIQYSGLIEDAVVSTQDALSSIESSKT